MAAIKRPQVMKVLLIRWFVSVWPMLHNGWNSARTQLLPVQKFIENPRIKSVEITKSHACDAHWYCAFVRTQRFLHQCSSYAAKTVEECRNGSTHWKSALCRSASQYWTPWKSNVFVRSVDVAFYVFRFEAISILLCCTLYVGFKYITLQEERLWYSIRFIKKARTKRALLQMYALSIRKSYAHFSCFCLISIPSSTDSA